MCKIIRKIGGLLMSNKMVFGVLITIIGLVFSTFSFIYQNKRRIPLPLQVGDECEKTWQRNVCSDRMIHVVNNLSFQSSKKGGSTACI